jgi:hypothetical protein
MVSKYRHVIGLATGTDRFLADTFELLSAIIAAVVLPLYPLIVVKVPCGRATNSAHVLSPHYDIFTRRFNGI